MSKYSFQRLNSVPKEIREILLENERLSSQNQILKAQVKEKNTLIQQLKNDIDVRVLDNNKNKLQYLRYVDKEIQNKVSQIKQQYQEQKLSQQKEIFQFKAIIRQLEDKISKLTEFNKHLSQKLQSMYSITFETIVQKDKIIKQLIQMIPCHKQNEKILSQTSCEDFHGPNFLIK